MQTGRQTGPRKSSLSIAPPGLQGFSPASSRAQCSRCGLARIFDAIAAHSGAGSFSTVLEGRRPPAISADIISIIDSRGRRASKRRYSTVGIVTVAMRSGRRCHGPSPAHLSAASSGPDASPWTRTPPGPTGPAQTYYVQVHTALALAEHIQYMLAYSQYAPALRLGRPNASELVGWTQLAA
ncbi:hypothetical protein PYCCODRAFT_1222103 [Trametes coccinea BRFM310]|uniref:Uncharacterized protein n=1 Tax=Trametes coccinea (strain BRFM310) TaxID=1353009 RepID=A0A1Y2IVX8_TRAC3|nr:hypothetical protein PYCCODRAFT_1222103 [Trametes coccinea BRFM310]